MRFIPTLGCGLLLASFGAAAASDVRPVASPSPGPLSELRFGGFAHDLWGPEGSSANLSGEILLHKPFTPADLFTSYFVPRPHLGGSLNLSGRTSFAYTGLTWTFDLAPRLFIEGSLGGAIHTGHTDTFVPPDRAMLGCSPLFRESGAVGVRLSANWSLVASVERLSNAGLCSQNQGLTNFGARLGYTF
jgi:lipid A 3-O-deacylase